MPRSITLLDLGLTEYREVLDLQRRLQAERHSSDAEDTLLLTEHRPVITLGRAHSVPDLRVAPAALEAQGIEVVQAERGGDITYHGPGQLVAYGIIDLRAWDLALLDYVGGLEETVIRVLARWAVAAHHRPGARGVWVAERKIASLGLHVRRWVTMHGIALNVAREVDAFDLINPCGMPGVQMTSLANECGRDVPMEAVKAAFVAEFARLFNCELEPADPGPAPNDALPRGAPPVNVSATAEKC